MQTKTNNLIKVQIVSHKKKYPDIFASSLVVETTTGEVNILPYHIEYLGEVKISTLTIKNENEENHYAVGGGIIHFIQSTNTCRLILNSIYSIEEIDIALAEKEKEEALAVLKSSASLIERKSAERSLQKAINSLNVKGKYNK